MRNKNNLVSTKLFLIVLFYTNCVLDCLLILFNTPIALINTISEELPALINGSGSPVGGIEPDIT